jgi:hypothetical protein
MDINITSLLVLDMFTFSHSRAEGGQDAGRDTWNASKEDAKDRKPPLLDTPEKLETFREWVGESGGWTREEIAAWDEIECNALFLQWVAGDCREAGADTLEDIDWKQYEEDSRAGQVSSNLYRADDGQIYFSLSH